MPRLSNLKYYKAKAVSGSSAPISVKRTIDPRLVKRFLKGGVISPGMVGSAERYVEVRHWTPDMISTYNLISSGVEAESDIVSELQYSTPAEVGGEFTMDGGVGGSISFGGSSGSEEPVGTLTSGRIRKALQDLEKAGAVIVSEK